MSGLPPDPGAASGWYPDPFRRHELRFRDGALWTEHVSDLGVAAIDTTPVAGLERSRPPDRTAGSLAPPMAAGAPVRVVPTTSAAPVGLLDALVLVVDDASAGVRGPRWTQRSVTDEWGRLVGLTRVRAEPLGARSLRMLTSAVVPEVTEVDVCDPEGGPLFSLARPSRRLKPVITVRSGDGSVVGNIVPRRLLNAVQYTLEVAGSVVAVLEAVEQPDRQAWVVDPAGQLLARTSTTWEVPSASFHAIADTHLILREGPLAPPLSVLVVASLLGLDAMLLAEPPLVEG